MKRSIFIALLALVIASSCHTPKKAGLSSTKKTIFKTNTPDRNGQFLC